MAGLGLQELLILLIILGMMGAAVGGVVMIAVWAQRSQQRHHTGNPNLQSCPDCGGAVSRLAPSCPHCGRPLK